MAMAFPRCFQIFLRTSLSYSYFWYSLNFVHRRCSMSNVNICYKSGGDKKTQLGGSLHRRSQRPGQNNSLSQR